tara:strand:- start:6 stop:833 length:828 start_codon:yes stop_codon:yes gene_type:complete
MENNSKQTYHYLYIPGNRLELVKKAYEKKVKNIIIDLEDSVPHKEKEIVRTSVCEFVTENDLDININIRINSDYEMQKKDIKSVLKTKVRNVFVPKLEINSAIVAESLGDEFENIIGIIETAKGLDDLKKISSEIKIQQLAIGEVDFSTDLGIEETAQALLFYRSQLVYISKILNIKPPIGGVYKNIKDFEGLQKFAKNIKEIGFESMQAIHPEQVEIIDTAFKPTLDEINEAEELLRDIEYNDKKGIGVFVDSNGSIVDAAMVSKARKIANQSE